MRWGHRRSRLGANAAAAPTRPQLHGAPTNNDGCGTAAIGVQLITLSERYGTQEVQYLDDVDWMPDAAAAGEAVLMSDAAIRKKNPEERRVLIECQLRAFIVNAHLPAADTIQRFKVSLPAIIEACRNPGPFVYRLHSNRIQRGSSPWAWCLAFDA